MLPVVAIVGRPNVGKSTLFNRLTKTRAALVANVPGVTRDRVYGEVVFAGRRLMMVDTGGLSEVGDTIDVLIESQVKQACLEADVILLLVDGQSGLTPSDETIAKRLRSLGKPLFLVVNKTDGGDPDLALSEFSPLGIEKGFPLSALHGRGLRSLLTALTDELPKPDQEFTHDPDAIRMAILGRPNVGKSTLVNRLLGEERVVVSDMPGTTRDSIYVPLERRGKRYILIDTAGIRRRRKVTETVEKFSIVKSLQAISESHVVVVLIDAQETVTEQDLRLIGYVLDAGKGLVVAANKWDGLTQDQRRIIHNELDRRLRFVDFAKVHLISALHGTGVGNLFSSVNEAYASSQAKLQTPKLNQILSDAITQHPPPIVGGKRIKLRYAHAGGHNPPIIVIHGSQTNSLPNHYRRYLENTYRERLRLKGTPVRIELR